MFSYLLFKCFLVKWTCHKHLKVIKKEIYILQASPICSHISKGSSFQVTESCTCLISGWLSTAVFPIMLLSNDTSRQPRTYPFKSERNIRNFRKIPYKLVYNRENIRYENRGNNPCQNISRKLNVVSFTYTSIWHSLASPENMSSHTLAWCRNKHERFKLNWSLIQFHGYSSLP